ncbi:hypothetical protein [Enterococcus sp. AZ007]|uniref:hypothetical protein n=1 Tax=Enterococcus sp. AZ007 TaxID=2774839 RepID=UPI003E45500C
MKKTNFVVVFWLLLTLISFVIFLFNFHSFWDAISSLIFTSPDGYRSKNDLYREMFTDFPMMIVTSISFYIGLKQGLKVYNQS